MQGITKSRVAVRELLMEVLHELLGVGNVVVRNTHSEVAVVHRLSKRQLEDLDIWPCREMGKRGAKKGLGRARSSLADTWIRACF